MQGDDEDDEQGTEPGPGRELDDLLGRARVKATYELPADLVLRMDRLRRRKRVVWSREVRELLERRCEELELDDD